MVKSVKGMDYVRPPELKFNLKKETDKYTKYEVETFKNSKIESSDDVFTRDIDTLIYCNPTITIKVPKPEFMKDKDGNAKFAYAFGMFPNPKNGKAAYLDGCILGALGLKRQKTLADVICFITHDISKKDKKKLEIVFDKVIYVPYISPYDMGGEGDLKTIMMDPGIFKNCPNYTEKHPYSHVFFKLHIFNPELFPYEKVCFVDSDLVPMNFYDSLFMLNTPAGWVEYRKKLPYKDSFHWDRCDFLKHGDKIPKIFTDIDTPGGSDVNAGLMVVKPSKKEYDKMITELTSPIKEWMGASKYHKGFYSFDFDSLSGNKFVKNSYCYPEQNYLTKRYSGDWTYVEFAFQSWTLDPCNSFGIHMAAFNPKPWFKQPIGMNLQIKDKSLPYSENEGENRVSELIDLPKAFVGDDLSSYYENISYSYEIFNDLIIWGLVQYPDLKDFFVNFMEIRGPKISFDRDQFKPINDEEEFILLKDIEINSKTYKKLSLSQRYICNLLNDYDKYVDKIKDKYLNVCLKKKKNRYDEDNRDLTIVTWPDYKTKTKSKLKSSSRTNRKKTKRKKKKSKRKAKTIQNKKKKLLYFFMKGCKYCKQFEKTWTRLKKNHKNIRFMKINGPDNDTLADKYDIDSYPSLILINNSGYSLFDGKRTYQNIKEFILGK